MASAVATVIIPARDAEGTVGRAVEAVKEQTDAHGGAVRVIVVDDGSVDRTGQVAREAGAEVLRAEGEGPARARNLGISAAETPLIIFTDADCTPIEGFVSALLAPFSDERVAGAKGAYLSEQRSLVARFVQVEYEERYDRMARREVIDFIDTYAAAYRRSVLEAVGGFDERYRLPSTEDQELSFRIAQAGHRLVFAPAARVLHLHADTLVGYARKKAKIGYYKVATLRRHPDKAISDSHTPLSLKLQLVLAPLVVIGSGVLGLGLFARAGGELPAGLGPTLAAWGPLLGAAPALLFALTAAALWLRVLRRDPVCGLFAPALIFIRALALGVGVALGVARELRGGVLTAEAAPAAGGA